MEEIETKIFLTREEAKLEEIKIQMEKRIGWNEIAKNPELYGINSEPLTLKSLMISFRNIAKVRLQQNYEKWLRR
jgi:hypothetical protein